ncbi:hypothetical protein Tco_1459083 [Tanacetum coccineum]
MDSIEKAIDERGLYKIVHNSRVNERTMQTHEGMISKDASDIDNNVVGASHDKDNLTKDKHRNVDSNKGYNKFFLIDVVSDSMFITMKCSTIIQHEITEEVQEMLNIFESMERKVDRTSKKNENFQYKIDQLLDANIANDVKIIVMQSYVEIKNNEEIERFSNESKEGDMFCNVVVEVKEKLSKQIVQLEKDFAKLEAQSIAFEIALQHKTQENKSLKRSKKRQK